jgi:hypothetical protein
MAPVSHLTPEEAVIIVNAYGETLEELAAMANPRWETEEEYRRAILDSADPVSLLRRTYRVSLLPYSKNGIREALHVLLAHPDVEPQMKDRLRKGLLSLDDFIEADEPG